MMRAVLVMVLVAMIGACATDDTSYPVCDPGEGPVDMTFTYEAFKPVTLTCELEHTREYCTGDCCHAMSIMLTPTPISCTGMMCVGLDEATCMATSPCYVARDRDAFTAGAPSFIGCYPPTGDTFPQDCATRDAYYCGNGGTCAGLYTQTATGAMFFSCIDKTATMP